MDVVIVHITYTYWNFLKLPIAIISGTEIQYINIHLVSFYVQALAILIDWKFSFWTNYFGNEKEICSKLTSFAPV